MYSATNISLIMYMYMCRGGLTSPKCRVRYTCYICIRYIVWVKNFVCYYPREILYSPNALE